MSLTNKKFDPKQNPKTKIGNNIYEIVENGERVNGARRTIVKIDSFGKRVGENIKQAFNGEKWINLNEYLQENVETPLSRESFIKKMDLKKDNSRSRKLISYFSSADSVFKKGDKKYFQEKFLNINDERQLESKETKLISSEYQNNVVREKIKIYNLPEDTQEQKIYKIEKRNELEKRLLKEISEKAVILEKYPDPETGKKKPAAAHKAILEAGIESAYIFAIDFLKNKKPNEELWTNDRQDAFYKIDYIKTVYNEEDGIEEIYFIQVKSNLNDAEKEQEKVLSSHKKYLESVKVISKEEFEKLKQIEFEKRFNIMYPDGKTKNEKTIPQNLLFANKFFSSTCHVDRKTQEVNYLKYKINDKNKEKEVENVPLTLNLK